MREVDQQVIKLKITVHNPLVVHGGASCHYLLQDLSRYLLREPLLQLQDTLKGAAICVLQDAVEVVACCNQFYEANHVGTLYHLKEEDLAGQ